MEKEPENNSVVHGFDCIVLLVDEFPPAVAGGIATWALVFSEDLERRGHKVVVMAPRKLLKRAVRASCKSEVRYIGWHDWAKYRGIYSFLGVLPLLLKGKRLLIVGSTWQHLTVIAQFKKFINARTVCFSHGTDVTRAITPPRRARFKKVLEKTDLFAPTSVFLDKLVKRSFPDVAIKSAIVYNGIDAGHFRPLRESKADFRATFGIDPAAIVVASAGRLIPAKGFDTLIIAVGKACKTVPAIQLVIAGAKDEEYPRLNKICADEGVTDRVTFAGRIPYEKLPEFYNAADIGVLASIPLHKPYYIEDNFPLMLLEAAGCGLPLIGTVCGGIPEIIEDSKCGYLVPPSDSNRLAQRLVELAQDRELRIRMGHAARVRVKKYFTRERMVDEFLESVRALA